MLCLDTNGDAISHMRERRPAGLFRRRRAASELLEKIGGARARAFVVTVNNQARGRAHGRSGADGLNTTPSCLPVPRIPRMPRVW